jgi:CMP-N-acetylneuraminic acid synthetase
MGVKTLGIIPARGGSKGIPRKNLRHLGNKPLIAWTIEQALGATLLDDIIVTTEDEEIADVAKRWGAKVPFMRPPELAQDTTPGIDVIMHALDYAQDFQRIVVLQPTSPFRTSTDIDGIVQFCNDRRAPSGVSITPASKHPYWAYTLSNEELAPLLKTDATKKTRQELPQAYNLNGALYLAEIQWLKRTKTLIHDTTLGYVMPTERSIDLDTELDWDWAEFLLEKQKHA